MPVGRETGAGSLAAWMELPRIGPQRLIFAGVHTIAENGAQSLASPQKLVASRSRIVPRQLWLMSSGAQTILLSRWRVGGQSTIELIREFVQELPRTSAADAWQRCVEVAKNCRSSPPWSRG